MSEKGGVEFGGPKAGVWARYMIVGVPVCYRSYSLNGVHAMTPRNFMDLIKTNTLVNQSGKVNERVSLPG